MRKTTGMAFVNIATDRSATFFENLMATSAVNNPFFGYYIQHAGNGQLCLGCTDPTKYTGSIVYAPVTVKGYWQVALGGIALNGVLVAGTASGAAIDTSTTLIYVPTTTATAIYTALGGKYTNGQWTVACSSQQSISFVFAGIQYAVPLSSIDLGYASATSTTDCLYGIIGSNNYDLNGAPVAVVRSLLLSLLYSCAPQT